MLAERITRPRAEWWSGPDDSGSSPNRRRRWLPPSLGGQRDDTITSINVWDSASDIADFFLDRAQPIGFPARRAETTLAKLGEGGGTVRAYVVALKQGVVRAVVHQFGHPHGIGGRLAGWVMAHRSSNRRRNRWVVSLLDVQSADRVLEIGFGPGLAIAELSRRATRGTVYGIDHSEVMLQHATKRNAAAIRAKHVELVRASVERPPRFEGPLDAILAVNSLGFWPEPTQRLVELRALLRPGGRIAIAAQPRCPGATEETSANAAREIETLLHEASFSQAQVETLDLDPPVVCVIARRR